MISLWIDTDLALGAPRGDVDDGFAVAAVVAALRGRPGTLLGISAVGGNTDAAMAHRCIGRLLEEMGGMDLAGEVPVFPQEGAAMALSGLPDGGSILALGPLTNVVRAAALDPSLPARVSVRAVGGVLDRRRHPVLPLFCLNFRHDPVAGDRFGELPWRHRRLFPLDVVRRLRISPGDLDRLEALGGAAAYLGRESRRWSRRAPLRYLSRSFPAWDLVAALDAVGELPGARFEDLEGSAPGALADRLVDFDPEAAKERFFELLATP